MKIFKWLPGALLISLLFMVPVRAAGNAQVLSVVNISTPDKIGYAIYWPSGLGTVNLERSTAGGSWANLASTDKNFYVDYDVLPKTEYTYRVGTLVATSSEDTGGQPVISEITIAAGAVSKTEASVIISFQTDRLAKSQVFYGESASYTGQSDLSSSLNQSHTILVEKLKPSTTYHFKVRAQDKTDKAISESSDQTFTTPKPPTDLSIMEIIIQALSNAFSGFQKWFSS